MPLFTRIRPAPPIDQFGVRCAEKTITPMQADELRRLGDRAGLTAAESQELDELLAAGDLRIDPEYGMLRDLLDTRRRALSSI